MTDQVVLWSTY